VTVNLFKKDFSPCSQLLSVTQLNVMYAILENPTKCPVYCREIVMGKKQKRARAYKGIELQTL